MDFQQVFLALAYVIPGFVGYQLYRAAYPGKTLSDTLVVMWSLIHTLVIHVGFGVSSWVLSVPKLNYLARPPQTLGWRSAALLLAGGVVYGLLLIVVRALRLKLNLWPPDPLTIWGRINLQESGYYALVRLKDHDLCYMGWVSDFRLDPDTEDQDFLLRDASLVDENIETKYQVAGLGVYLNTRDVAAIEYLYGE